MTVKYYIEPPLAEGLLPSLNITAPDIGVQILANEAGTVVWINVDGQCVLRVCRAPKLEVEV